jgi:hypothetical protein
MSAGLENSDHRPPVRYKKDVWSWESLDEWEALKFTRFEALLINISLITRMHPNETVMVKRVQQSAESMAKTRKSGHGF